MMNQKDIKDPKDPKDPKDQTSGSGVLAAPKSPAPILIPLALLLLASVVFRLAPLDLAIAHSVWDTSRSGWTYENLPVLQMMYQYGPLPTLATGIAAGLFFLVLWIRRSASQHRQLASFLALLLLLGPGLIVNVILKDHFGRPRPNQVVEFGGPNKFQKLGEPNFAVPGKSFPSGHASVGFYWFGLFVFFWRKRPGLAWCFFALALLHGGALGLTRILQGRHWASDVIWSAGIVYLAAWLLARWLGRGGVATSVATQTATALP